MKNNNLLLAGDKIVLKTNAGEAINIAIPTSLVIASKLHRHHKTIYSVKNEKTLLTTKTTLSYSTNAFSEKGQGTLSIHDEKPLASKREFNASFSITHPAKNKAGKADSNQTYQGIGQFITPNEDLPHNNKATAKPELLLTGDMVLVEFEGIKVMPKKETAVLTGSSDVFRQGRAVCLLGDEKQFTVNCPYIIPDDDYCIGGEGLLSIVTLKNELSSHDIRLNDTPLLLSSHALTLKFVVTQPSKKHPDDSGDPVTEYRGRGTFAVIRSLKNNPAGQ